MKDFKGGVAYYTTKAAVIQVHFPEDDVCCFHCWMRYKDSADRQMCRLLNEELYSIQYGVREDCPLKEIENGKYKDL